MSIWKRMFGGASKPPKPASKASPQPAPPPRTESNMKCYMYQSKMEEFANDLYSSEKDELLEHVKVCSGCRDLYVKKYQEWKNKQWEKQMLKALGRKS